MNTRDKNSASGPAKSSRETRFSVMTIVYAGLLTAMHVVFARFVSIPVGQTLRISVSGVPLILSGMWLGPAVGGLCGLTGDLIGCAISGYVPNPFITLATVLVGVLPALFLRFMTAPGGRARRVIRFLIVIALTRLLTSQIITTFGLSMMYGMPFWPTFLGRLPSTTAVTVADAVLCEILYSRVRLPDVAG